MDKLTIRDIDVSGKRVLVRVDFNVPQDEKTGAITDDSRIRATLPTINYLIDQRARVILASHLGRPGGKVVDKLRLTVVAQRLSQILGKQVGVTKDCIGPETKRSVASLMSGDVVLLENLRFHSAEEMDNPIFARALARLADIYVNGAYAPSAIAEDQPLTDLRVRKAISMAINRQELIDTFFLGQAAIPGPPTISAASGDIDWPYWKDYAEKMWVYDLDEAKRLMAEAGYPDGFDKGTLIYTFASQGAPYLTKMAEIVQAYLAEIGIKVTVNPVEYPVYQFIRKEIEHPEIIGHMAMRDQDQAPVTPHEIEGTFCTWDNTALLNWAFPEVDQGVQDAFVELDQAKRQETLAKVIKICADSYTNIVFVTVPTLTSVSPEVDVYFPKGTQGVALFVEYFKHTQ
ncbi:phosphoglycerate kinase [Chloroflexota bacterium]